MLRLQSVCDWPENVECASAGGGDGVGGEQLPATEGPGDGGVENPGGETLDNGCPADWDEHRLLPHEYDCSLFYYCVHGNRVRGATSECCVQTEVCDWPENAGCGSGGGNTESPGAGSGEDNNVTEGPGNGSGEDNNVTEGPGNGSGEDNNVTEGPGNGSGEDNNVTEGPGNGSGEDNDVTEGPGNDSGEDDTATDIPGNGSGENPGNESGEWLENGCPADWDVHHLLPHESDCSSFYYCVHGELVARECPPGLHFNAVEQVCDWPDNAGCENGGGNTDSPGNGSEEENNVTDNPGNGSEEIPDSGSGEWLANGCPADWDVHHLLPHESDCTQFYYCVHGNLVARECPPGLHFNSVEQVCDWPENAGCDNGGGNTDSPGNGSEEENNVTDSPGNGSEEIPDSGSGEWLANGCPADWDVHHLLPHESDCTQFYYCVHGNLVARECPPGLHFNSVEQVCDWPENAGCENSGGNTDNPGTGSEEENNVTDGPSNGSEEDNDVTDNPGNGGEEDNVTESPENGSEDNNVTDSPGNGSEEIPEVGSGEWLENGCPADWNVHHLLPHESDCTQLLLHGELVARECSPGLHFNPVEQVCDWPDNAGCENGGGNTDSPGNVTEEDNDVTDSPGNGSQETPGAESAEWLENGCPADWSIHHLLPHETDCTKFYYCVRGELVERECAPGLHFNPTIQVCDWPDNAGCANGGGSNEISDSSSEENNEVTDGPASGSEENNEVTDGPASGSEENNEVTDGPASGSEENNDVTDGPGNNSEENNGVTEGPGNGSAESAEWLDNGCPADWTIHHLLPHETECTKFYYCVHGDLVLSECSGGLHFNPILQRRRGDGRPSDQAPSNGSGEDSEEGSGSGSEEETGSPQDDICANECHVAHWAHETDCDKFWKCKDGKAVLGVCSEGLHFNREEQTCDFICNVNCVRETIQATVGETGLKLFVPWDKIDDKLLSAYKLLEL
ncbi:Probable chitinase 10 [Eumeta japonica]|uniref:Probable chitinase 10 n=1 Tax=Eumeta variegata TaxID=151549 RepID=A0A4C1XF36_EUMVA|nr:Probable chitinase 10 [Eumeta japonica]